MSERAASSKSADAYRTISEVAEDLGLPQHVLRFWETRFPQVKPLKRAGGRRFYRPGDVELLRAVKALLYDDGYTIKGVQRMLRDQGSRSLMASPAASVSAERASPEEAPAPVGIAFNRSSSDDWLDVPMPDGPPSLERLSPEPDGPTAAGSPPEPAFRPAKNGTTMVVARLEAVLHDLLECERLIRRVTTV